MAKAIWKPYSQGRLNRGGTSFVLPNGPYKSVDIYKQDGSFESLTRSPYTSEGAKFYSNTPGHQYGKNLNARVTLNDGTVYNYAIPNGGQRYEYSKFGSGSGPGYHPGGQPVTPGSETPPAETPPTDPGTGDTGDGGDSNIPDQFQPDPTTNTTVSPPYLGELYPKPTTIGYNPVKPAPYDKINPFKFGAKYGEFYRDEFGKAFQQGQDLGLQSLETELKGLQAFAPAAAAIKRQELAADNVFNQYMRTSQIDAALPGMRESLAGQTERANAYAEGRLPDSVQDRALELGVRSRAADQAQAGGFGARSSVSRKASELMSAQQRLGISEYGDRLLTTNAQLRANLELAPTSYSDAGQQIRVMPEVGAGRAGANYTAQLAQGSTIPATTAFTAGIQQNQFKTNLLQQTRQFNASNQLAVDQFNANKIDNFALGLFGYQTNYANAVAGSVQEGINTAFGLNQQGQATNAAAAQQQAVQDANTAGAIAQGIGAAGGAAAQIIGAMNGGAQEQTPNNQAPVEQTQGTQYSPAPPEAGYPPGSNVYPNADSVPSDHQGIYQESDGSVVAVPQYQTPVPDGFYDTVGVSEYPTANSDVTKNLLTTNAVTMDAAGLSYKGGPGYQSMGYNPTTGAPMYSNTKMMSEPNANAPRESVDGVREMVEPLGVLNEEDKSRLDEIGNIASNVQLAGQLGAAVARRDIRGFIDTALNGIGYPALQGELKDPRSQAGAGAAFTLYNMFNHWDQMSTEQRGMALTSLGLQGYQLSTGQNLTQAVIPGTAGFQNTPGLTVGQAVNLLGTGVNVYSLINNWEEMSNLNRAVGGVNTTASIVQTAQRFNLIGQGTTGAATAADVATLSSAGWSTAGEYGVGAITAGAGTEIPAGYTAIASTADGGVVAIPAANIGSSAAGTGSVTGTAGATGGTTAAGVATTAAGAVAFGAGAYTVYQNWGTGGSRGAMNGALGGASMAAGLYAMGVALGPWGWAAIIAVSALSGLIHTGKPEEQNERDAYRQGIQGSGIVDDNFDFKLPDGATMNIGTDGHEGVHTVRNMDRFVDERDPQNLNAYDIDYTNDMDYFSGMAGMAFMRVMTGGKELPSEQIGGQIGNQALGSVGFGADMTYENFNKVMANHRAIYAKAGINTKQDAYALANKAYAEGRITDFDLIQAHQSFNMMYDEGGFETAKKLGRDGQPYIEQAINNPKPLTPPADRNTPSNHTYDQLQEQYPQFFNDDFAHVPPGYNPDPGMELPPYYKPGQVDPNRNIDPGFSLPPGYTPDQGGTFPIGSGPNAKPIPRPIAQDNGALQVSDIEVLNEKPQEFYTNR